MFYLPKLWLGVSNSVNQVQYAVSGLALMVLKYGVEALLIWMFVARVYWPWDFVNPLVSARTELLAGGPTWLGWFLFFWSLPFVWVALSMSVRRAADAGGPPWVGLLVLVPLVNLVFMVVMCFLPSAQGDNWSPTRSEKGPDDFDFEAAGAGLFALALSLGLLVGAGMIGLSVLLMQSYGGSLFMGAPLMMGVTSAYILNRRAPQGYGVSVGLGAGVILAGCAALLLFALEGFICIVMAMPIMVPLGAIGGLLGKAIADATRRSGYELMATIGVLPVLMLAETFVNDTPEYAVTTTVEIDAPPEVVWQNVIAFPELPPAEEWYFRAGIAAPQRARIEGTGVGAIRYCEFTTGVFVEPITHWEPGRRLAFHVTEQPAPMFELSPYRHVHPPHLHGYLRSNRGEFLLVELPDGRTRLQGTTWYEFEMFPQAYWTLWSHDLIHRIHLRVLNHVKREAEGARTANIAGGF